MTLPWFLRARAPLAWVLGGVGAIALACNSDSPGACYAAGCICDPGTSCSFGCPAPPCRATCAGDNPACDAVCANGECQCGPRSSCNFVCQSPPCHTTCLQNSICTATCADGDC